MATKYSYHARQRMILRKITKDQVDLVLRAPQRFKDDPDNNSVRLERDLQEGTLKVWVVAPWPDGDRITVKSVAWKD